MHTSEITLVSEWLATSLWHVWRGKGQSDAVKTSMGSEPFGSLSLVLLCSAFVPLSFSFGLQRGTNLFYFPFPQDRAHKSCPTAHDGSFCSANDSLFCKMYPGERVGALCGGFRTYGVLLLGMVTVKEMVSLYRGAEVAVLAVSRRGFLRANGGF